jgi:DNA-binding phage protein
VKSSPVTPATIESRATINRLLDRVMELTGRDVSAVAAAAGLARSTLLSWLRGFDQSHRNPSLAQLTALFDANGFRLLLAIEPLASISPGPYAQSTLRCGTKDKRSPVETLWLDGRLVGSVAPASVAQELVARWEATAARHMDDAAGSAGD